MSRVRGRPGPLRTQGLGNGVSGTGEWGWERASEPGERPELRALSAEASGGAGEIKASGGETVRNRKKREWAKSPDVRDGPGPAGRGSAPTERGGTGCAARAPPAAAPGSDSSGTGSARGLTTPDRGLWPWWRPEKSRSCSRERGEERDPDPPAVGLSTRSCRGPGLARGTLSAGVPVSLLNGTDEMGGDAELGSHNKHEG